MLVVYFACFFEQLCQSFRLLSVRSVALVRDGRIGSLLFC